MTRSIFGALRWIAHTYSGFGAYIAHNQRRCMESGRSSDCGGLPTTEEALKDYRAMIEASHIHHLI